MAEILKINRALTLRIVLIFLLGTCSSLTALAADSNSAQPNANQPDDASQASANTTSNAGGFVDPQQAEVPTPGSAPSAAVSAGQKKAVTTAAKEGPSRGKIAAGQKVFSQMQCFTCHAGGGNVINPSKPIKGASFLQKYPDDAQIAQIIRNGVTGTAMPAFSKERLSDDQLDSLIAYVRSLTQ